MLTIQFESDLLDSFLKRMFVKFESGEELCIDLAASTRNGAIWLEPEQISFNDTFMGLKREQKVTLYNDTHETIKFCWHQYENIDQELGQLGRLKNCFENVKLNETKRCVQLQYNEILTEDNHANIYSRIMEDQVELLTPKDYCFRNKNFEISPLEGELWPGGRCFMTVVFSPHTVGSFCCTAYCNATGVAHRLPLRMGGVGLGPVVQLNLRSLDIGPVFLGLTQSYEIVAANKGDIPCRVEHVLTNTVFGGVLTVQPPVQCLMPYEIKSFIISFCSGRTGSFVEDVLFKITQSEEVLRVMLKGNVVNPTISFDCAKLDFGSVAVGFPQTLSVGLVNQSQVPVEFALRVPSDGSSPPITCQQFASVPHKPGLVSHCQEFTISPDSGVIQPNTTLHIQVTLITNTERKHLCVMVAENKNSKLLESISLSLVYESRVAAVTCSPPQLVFRFSFINYQYTADITLTNTSTLPAYFYIPPQSVSGALALLDGVSFVWEIAQADTVLC
ncbi:hydrocephalus-inducing protein homolog [Macrosteles quadrilineatus]|uniref:hydrocephalus-inducing protein homolog n=1 Tax=Macrosteles quadrilineatus TaxID=74068 RepID=UPI0023E19B17|nr:hydrocephalus-inducing protein homolog [Macrosteles quadrilineatus]